MKARLTGKLFHFVIVMTKETYLLKKDDILIARTGGDNR